MRPSRSRRPLLVGLLVVLLVAGGFAGWWAIRGEDPGGGGPGQSTASPTLSAAEEALRDLPRSTDPLGETQLVVPRAGVEDVDLFLVSSATGESGRRLTVSGGDDVGPVVSPDRRSIGYARVSGGAVELRVVAADGSVDRPLFTSPPADCPVPGRPVWNPRDPSQVAVICSGSGSEPDVIKVIGLDGTTIRTLEPGHLVLGDLAFSANGTWLGYWAGEDRALDGGDLYYIAADGSMSETQLTEVPGRADADLVWSPDGSQIALRRLVAEDESQIVVTDSFGRNPRSLTSGAIDQDPIWSPDGTQLAFKSDRAGPHGAGDHIWVMDANGRNLRQLPTAGSPDSYAVAWGLR